MSGWTEQDLIDRGHILSPQGRRAVAERFANNPEAVKVFNGLTGPEALEMAKKGRALLRKARQHPERDLEKACEDLLEYDGWRIFRLEQNFSERKIKSVGEAGAPDGMYIRYLNPADFEEVEKKRWTEVFFIEWKSPTGKTKAHQKAWHAQERARGALVAVVGEDFPADKDSFCAWYRGSGLMRRPI